MEGAIESGGHRLVRHLGIEIIGREGHDIKCPCIACESSDAFRIHQDTGVAHCYSCKVSYSPFQLANAVLHDESTARNLLVEVGLAESRKQRNGHKSRPGATLDSLELVSRQKRVSPEGFRSYGAKVEAGRVVFPMFGPDGEACSTFTLTPGSGKGTNEKNKPTGLFFPGKLPKPGETWHIVEGVKDAAALHGLGLLAAGLPSNAMAPKFARLFAGVDVVLVPDRDRAGEHGSQKTAIALHGHSASIRIACLPAEFAESKGSDVRDVLQKPDGTKLVRQAIEDAKVWEPSKELALTDSANSLSLWTPEGRTEIANAKRLAAFHGQSFRWCEPWGKWIVWDGYRWKPDDTCQMDAFAKDVAAKLWRDMADAVAKAHGQPHHETINFVKASNEAKGIHNMISLAKSEPGVAVLPSQFDTNPWLFNTVGGTIDLHTGTCRPAQREDFITQLSPVNYRQTSSPECPTWINTLETMFKNNANLIGFVRRWLGFCLTGDVREQLLPIWHGSGSNGKSTILNMVMDVMGADYAMKAPTDFLTLKRGQTHPTERADLFGKRFVAAVETEDGNQLAEALVKDLTGGDRIRARRMREDFWEFPPTHKITLATNHQPVIRGADHAIWRRIGLVPFAVQFWDSEKGESGPEYLRADKALQEKLRRELPGILSWMVEGCLEWQRTGLGVPDDVQKATDKYRKAEDSFGEFLAACCVVGQAYSAPAGKLLEAYKEFTGDREISQRKLGKILDGRGFHNDRYTCGPNRGRFGWFGIGLLSPSEASEPSEASFP